MLHKINGLPAHVLLVHVVVVFVPLSAVMLVASAAWPAARRKLGFLTPAAALVALVFVPITTNAGDWLRDRIDPHHQNKLINRHADLGGELLPLAIAVFVLAAAVWILGRRFEMEWRAPRPAAEAEPGRGGVGTLTRPTTRTSLPVWVTAAIAVVSTVVAVITIIQLVRIGDAGAQAVWKGTGS